MDPYGQGTYDYRYERRVPRGYDIYPPQVEYPRPAQRVYAVAPAVAAASYPAPTSNRRVEIHYYNPEEGLPVPMPIRPGPAPIFAAAPPAQIQYPQLPSGSGSQFVPGQMYKVVGVEEAQIHHAAPPRAEYQLDMRPSSRWPPYPPPRPLPHPYY